ncbi:restriction endonuclease subunit S [Guptibacillus hwajinpoensis]|uniref:restriction endonuclease subunit S n=1 Tax=Guptibacillus hwajinpoensis TaxID=208199 RepID=UPI001CD29BE5|nr:restriction endonuclease subunit S [Pseudalkalibacillus hwajinpoensis]MCA0991684.1 restriction endonuclease subunit S [Pseudalkalibacillus hwajinpoensis]
MDAKKLEGSILQFALQGKLVPQDPKEEPASELVERIKAEKERLIQEKIIKKEKLLPKITEEEIPFEIPETWEWVRIRDVYYNRGQKKPDKEFTYIDVAAIDNQEGALSNQLNIIDPQKAPSRARKILGVGDVVYATVRPYLLNIAVIDRNFEYEPIASTAFVVMKPILIDNEFLYFILKSPMFNYQVESKVQGVTYPAINDTNFNKLLIPLPPVKEQKRIVRAIKNIKPKIDTYSEKKNRLFKIQEAFPHQLERSILQYAMQGDLIKQNSDDEPVIKLIDRIKAMKEKLIEEKVVPKEKTLTENLVGKSPFKIPTTWEWVRLKDICQVNPKNKVHDEMKAGFVPMKLIDDGFVNHHSFEVKTWKDIKKGFTHFQNGDVVIAKITPCFENRKSTIIKGLPNGVGAGTTELFVVRPFTNDINPEYLLWLFKSHHFITSGVETYTGTAGQQRVAKSFVENYLIPLPPVEEQNRLVQAINKVHESISKMK